MECKLSRESRECTAHCQRSVNVEGMYTVEGVKRVYCTLGVYTVAGLKRVYTFKGVKGAYTVK